MIDTLITAARQATAAQRHLIPALNISEQFGDMNARIFFRAKAYRLLFWLNLYLIRRLGELLDSPEFPSFEYWFIKLPRDTPYDKETRSFQIDNPENCSLAISNAMDSLTESAATMLSDKAFLSPFYWPVSTATSNPLKSLKPGRDCVLDLQSTCMQNSAPDAHIWHYVDHILLTTSPQPNPNPQPTT